MKSKSTANLQIKDIVINVGKVCVIGNGAWGTALAGIVSQPPLGFKVFVFAVPTNALRNVLNEIKEQIDDKTLIINASKGIELKTHKLPFEIVEEVLGKKTNYFSLIGPSFAQEVMNKNPTIVNLGYRNKKYIKQAKKVFQSTYFNVVPTKCLRAIEMMGSFKNIYAIGCGMADGLGYGANTRTKLIIFAYQELKRLLKAFDYKYDNSAQIAFLGDLVLTCNSTESRNFTFGKLLVHSSIDKSLNEIGQTTEGYFSIASVKYFEEKSKIKLPFAKLVHDVIVSNNHNTTKKSFTEFILRPN